MLNTRTRAAFASNWATLSFAQIGDMLTDMTSDENSEIPAAARRMIRKHLYAALEDAEMFLLDSAFAETPA